MDLRCLRPWSLALKSPSQSNSSSVSTVSSERCPKPGAKRAFWRGAGWDDEQVAHASERGWAGFRRVVTPMPLSYRRIKDGDMLAIGGGSRP